MGFARIFRWTFSYLKGKVQRYVRAKFWTMSHRQLGDNRRSHRQFKLDITVDDVTEIPRRHLNLFLGAVVG